MTPDPGPPPFAYTNPDGRAYRSAFTCPRCGAVSHHPGDVAAGYCGRCHDWTAAPAPAAVTSHPAVTRAVLRIEYADGTTEEMEALDLAGPVTARLTEPPPPDIISRAARLVPPPQTQTLTLQVTARRFNYRPAVAEQPPDEEEPP